MDFCTGHVGEQAAEPALVDVEHLAAFGLLGDGFLSLAFGADEEHILALRGHLAHEPGGVLEHLERFLKVDNVNAVAFAEDIFLHLGIPALGLVPEVNAGFEQFLHRYCGKLPPNQIERGCPLATPASATRPKARFAPRKRHQNLSFGELEPLAGALLSVLLSFVRARVAGQKAELLQPGPQFRIEFHQGPGNAQTGRARLAGNPAAIGEDQQIELIRGLGGRQRLPHQGARTLRGKVILERAAVNFDLALAGPQENAGHRSLPASRTQILNDRRCH